MLDLETNCAIPPRIQLLAVWSPCTEEIFTGMWAENDRHDLPRKMRQTHKCRCSEELLAAWSDDSTIQTDVE